MTREGRVTKATAGRPDWRKQAVHGLYDKIIFNINPGNVKAGKCPSERHYIKAEHENCHRLCTRDDNCPENMKCCPDNCHMMCKPPAADKPGTCPKFESSYSVALKCNDNCTSDSECPGTTKCCFKTCGKTCTPTLSDIAKPNMVSTASRGFCPQEDIYNCILKERKFCDEASCLDGYRCCPKICRWECAKSRQERAGECPPVTKCSSEGKACSSDYDCSHLFKCCSACGNRCVKAVNVPSFLHNATAT
ncbi:WAP four-disulfide core domain protein 3 [Rhinoderma darwinii]|uniref:WAP four-disulfide core domain protein 3 n=1 Tax=Rhinoderma darwinii TaxID=43563 RepID=UPI003F6718A9